MYITYLDYPEIPKELLEDSIDIYNKPRSDTAGAPFSYSYFRPKDVPPILAEWATDTFQMPVIVKYQIILKGIHIHKDVGNRLVALNYLLETGGDNVSTVVYDEDTYTSIQSEVIPLHKWHRLTTCKFHTVKNINPETFRLSVSVTPVDQMGYIRQHFTPEQINLLNLN